MWVMEKSGTVLYDTDPSLIGLNVFTDKAFERFPEMRLACAKMVVEPFGKTAFSTRVFWEILLHQGNEWIFIWMSSQTASGSILELDQGSNSAKC
jgi:hypothetical protein